MQFAMRRVSNLELNEEKFSSLLMDVDCEFPKFFSFYRLIYYITTHTFSRLQSHIVIHIEIQESWSCCCCSLYEIKEDEENQSSLAKLRGNENIFQ